MLENFIFENHLGQRFVGLENGVYLNANELRNYSWSYDVINSRITRFFRGTMKRKLPLVVCCKTTEEAAAVKNRLLDLAEADIEAMIPGRVYVGDYYTTGYLTSSKKTDYRLTGRFCVVTLELTSTEPAWHKETTHIFGGADAEGQGAAGGIDYAYDYPYDYAAVATTRQVMAGTVRGSKFRIRIYGDVTDPAITINEHVYAVKGRIRAGENLLIDSVDKTITLTTASGTKVNWFANRVRRDYIFESLPPGQNSVYYNGTFAFDLTIIEERSEPRWT